MVFLSAIRFVRLKNPDPFWKTRRLMRLTSYLYGRRRNCFRVAIRALHHVLEDCTRGRKMKKEDMKYLWNYRINQGAEEHGISGEVMRDMLERCKIFLNRKALADLAVWEPRTFKAITDVAKQKALEDDVSYKGKEVQDISHFISKGLLKND